VDKDLEQLIVSGGVWVYGADEVLVGNHVVVPPGAIFFQDSSNNRVELDELNLCEDALREVIHFADNVAKPQESLRVNFLLDASAVLERQGASRYGERQ
jgi:hypothetical protein